ncbi:MAG: PEP-CTERM sorting domain-containing protein [Fimbriimonadaceae bacterium]|nr:PEP-CTERM sorting domain-containing protein [Fimbriimonadaceae bacterium]
MNSRFQHERRARFALRSMLGSALLAVSLAHAQVYVTQPPVAGGGVMRWSQLWVDPSGNGNDLDSDAICYEGFVLAAPATIRHLDWWGTGASELGFQIEFWKQDPGTVAYQPWAVFRDVGALPEAAFTLTNIQTTAEGSITKYSVDLPTPVDLAANHAGNPRWFVAVIGKTGQPFATWNWAQSLAATGTFWWVRADGNNFHMLGDARAVDIVGNPVPEPTSVVVLTVGLVAALWRGRRTR